MHNFRYKLVTSEPESLLFEHNGVYNLTRNLPMNKDPEHAADYL